MSRGARSVFVALTGLTVVGSLAGCSVGPSMSAAAAKQFAAWQASGTKVTHAPSSPSPAETPTLDPTGTTPQPTPTSSATATAKPAPHATTPPKKPTSKPTPTPTKTVTPPAPAVYADGTYNSRGTYQVPSGQRETLRVTLNLTHDVVTSLTVQSVHVDSTAAPYEASFEGGINAVVVGRNIDSLNVGAVGGSSLTSTGFNSALANIKNQAKI